MSTLAAAAGSEAFRDLELLIRSHYGLVVLRTAEEERALTLVRLVSDRLTLPLFIWTPGDTLRRDGELNGVYGTQDADGFLSHVAASRVQALYFVRHPQVLLEDPARTRKLADRVMALEGGVGALLMALEGPELPEPLRARTATVVLPPPDREDFGRLLQNVLRDVGKRQRVASELSPADTERLLAQLRGLTLVEAEKVLTRSLVEDGRLTSADVDRVVDAKRAIVEREGVLEYYPAEETMADVADLAGLKAWLAKRRAIVADPAAAAGFGLTFPKGILLVGVPGAGKSLCAKAVAMDWKLPLLKLDPGRLYNKYVGESERNFRRACEVAERLAPCVLFIDELEKAFATGDEDGGLSQRVLGSFLAWLQDRRAPVFTVATANDVSRLPPEFLRKGRFDEIFFVDLPDGPSRAEIFRIHMAKRGRNSEGLDLPALAAQADGFSGAEIEQVVVSALYTAFATGVGVDTALLRAEVGATAPLSRTAAERIGTLRAWASGRAVPAN